MSNYIVGEAADLFDPLTGQWIGKVDLNGREQPLFDSTAAKATARLVRQSAKSAALRKPANPAATRANTTAYAASDVVAFSTGDLVICSGAGTSGASEPAFSSTAAVTDGTVTWQALNESTQAAEAGAPAVVVADVAGAPALSVVKNLFLDATSFAHATAPNMATISGSGATSRNNAWSILDGSTNNNGFGANGRSGKYRSIEFETAADVVEIGYFATTAGFPQERLRIWVNDYPVSEAPLVPGAVGSSRFFRLTITAPARTRRIRIACYGTMLLSYAAVGTGQTITPPVRRSPLMAFISDSFFDTESPSINSAHYDLGVQVAQKTGFPHCLSMGLGGTSYSLDASGRKALQVLVTLNTLAAFAPDVVAVCHGYNAANNGVAPATEATAALASWAALRRQAPTAPILVVGTWYRQPSFVAQHDAMQNALRTAFFGWRDENSVFVDPHDGSITRGDGLVIRPSGAAWFNSGNVSWAFPATGGAFDGFHPSTPGVNYVLAPALSDAFDTSLTALGY